MTETLEYRGVLDQSGNLAICSAWDDAGNLVRFAADYRLADAVPTGMMVVVAVEAILGRRAAFEVV